MTYIDRSFPGLQCEEEERKQGDLLKKWAGLREQIASRIIISRNGSINGKEMYNPSRKFGKIDEKLGNEV